MPPTIPGVPPPQPGNFNQVITPANAAWTQQLQIWTTPWGFLKGAAANNATVRSDKTGNVVTWSPSAKSPSGQPYRVVGYINPQNLVERVETWVDHPILGDMHVETTYSNYQDFGGVKVPTRMVQKQAGMDVFTADIKSATPNPPNIAELLTPPAAQAGGGGGGQAPPQVTSDKLAEGVYRILGGYAALAVEFADHVVLVESGQSVARGEAVLAEAKKIFPNKPIRYLVNTHAHFDHASGLAPIAAAGITIITGEDNRAFFEKALSAPRTLVGDALAKANVKPKIEGVKDRRVLQDGTRTLELHHIQNLAHTDGMLVVYLPKEKILFTADFNVPAKGQPTSPWIPVLVQNVDRLKLAFDRHVLVHTPNPDQPLTRADLDALAKTVK
jgi:glyoxylase-like metal-dependent hydrolase (beta-lactamase superfamily II)